MKRDRTFNLLLATAWLAIAAWALRAGLSYYELPPLERVDSPLHATFRPAGAIGHAYGVAGTAMMIVGVAGYSLRRRLARLAGVGRLSDWLRVHIFLCTLGPFLVVLHTTLKLGGIVSIAFWSMVIVVTSGVFGRYVYARIPHGVEGSVRDLADLAEETLALEARLRASGRVPADRLADFLAPPATPEPRGALHALLLSASGGASDRLHRRALARILADRGIPREARRDVIEVVLRRRRLLRASILSRSFRRMFGSWHLLHLPLAILLAVVTAIHVFVAYLFGYV